MASQVADALGYSHALCDEQGQKLGIIHRDVSPSNIMLAEAGSVKLLDFGIAKAVSGLSAEETRTGVLNKHLRVEALRGAYLDALGTACRRLEVSPPVIEGHPVSPRANQAEIYRVEAALRQRGLDVREPAAH